MKVTLDPSLRHSADWDRVVSAIQCVPYDEGIGSLLVALMGVGHQPDAVEVRCGRQMLMWIAGNTKRPIALDGTPRVTFYSVAGVVTVREDAELEQEEIAFRARPAPAMRDPLNDPAWLAANAPDRATMAERREREATVFDEVAERYSAMREETARALIDYANIRKTSSGSPYVEPLDPLARKMEQQMRCQGAGIEAVFPIDDASTPAIRATGTWRVYFHRLNPDGLPWCVAPDAGGWEIAVANVAIDAPSSTVYAPKATPDDEDGRPSAWVTVTGVLTVSVAGQARISAA